jgi:uncharacterized cupin superfamily protein
MLGRAAGTQGVGVNRVRVAPGKLPTPPHSHGASEEIYYVLGGSGLLWQDEQVHEVRVRDCVIQRANELEHTFIAGADGLEFLVFGTRHPTELGWLPRSGAIRLGWPWVEGRVDDPWDTAAEQAVLNVDEVDVEQWGSTRTAPLATDDRSELAGFHWETLAPGSRGSVPHCHSEEEEIFVIIEGEGTLHLWPSPVAEARGATHEEFAIRPGHVIARPPATRVSHWFRAGASGLTMLIYGTRCANDMAWYPRSHKIFWRGLGVIGRIESLEYDDGEPDD